MNAISPTVNAALFLHFVMVVIIGFKVLAKLISLFVKWGSFETQEKKKKGDNGNKKTKHI